MKNVIIILGGGVDAKGELGDFSRQRVDAGVSIFKKGTASKIIMSGKYSLWSDWKKDIPPNSEAFSMKKYAESLGVKKEDIILEENAKDTLGNAYFTKVNILEPQSFFYVSVVTSDFHLPRVKYDFNLVLGPKYNIEYFSSDTKLSTEKTGEIVAQEKANTRAYNQLLGSNIKAGDTKLIQTVLFSKHPAYSQNPQFTYEKLFSLFNERV